ncbi:hypothetical protein [Granulicella paludicola]|uniref:hypothetical protein n=1 Tax=Granulicella paludicola TaxID=474951 RepID=UPI0021E0EEB4|nr:hypothetical protein [Granulicella paludicola]
MEAIVGKVFFCLIVAGLVLMIYGSQKSRSPIKRRKFLSLGMAIGGLAFLFFGATDFYLIRTSPRLSTIGTIANLHQSNGKYQSSNFYVSPPEGPATQVHSHYSGTQIYDGERVQVRTVEYDHSLLKLAVLSGTSAGWQIEENDGTASSCVLVAMGLLFGVGSWWESHEAPPSNTKSTLLQP